MSAEDQRDLLTIGPGDGGQPWLRVYHDMGMPPLNMAAGAALVYHGYKRTGSVVWALLYGVLGTSAPIVGGAIALAQGFGKAKP